MLWTYMTVLKNHHQQQIKALLLLIFATWDLKQSRVDLFTPKKRKKKKKQKERKEGRKERKKIQIIRKGIPELYSKQTWTTLHQKAKVLWATLIKWDL